MLAALCCAAAFLYPAINSWQSAWDRYHAWPNQRSFLAAFEPIAQRSPGLLYLPGVEANVAEYYTPQGDDWSRWGGPLSLRPSGLSSNALGPYYSRQLASGKYGAIALFYSTTFSSVKLPGSLLLPTPGGAGLTRTDAPAANLLTLVGDNSGEPGLAALTVALRNSRQYQRTSEGYFNTGNISGSHNYGIYVIWQRKRA